MALLSAIPVIISHKPPKITDKTNMYLRLILSAKYDEGISSIKKYHGLHSFHECKIDQAKSVI
ncbi:hypothetical protein OS42_05240 [Dickeya oryzae]